MKKILLVGRSECGKTTLTQALRGETIHYHKTQYVNHFDVIIDTPGEYAENKFLGRALALYSYEADVVGLLLSATEPYSLYPPCVAASANREVIGIVTQIDQPRANPAQAEAWLRLAGCFMSAPPAGTASGGSSNICGRRGTFCRGTTREPGEPGRRPGSFFLPSSIYTTEMQTTHADFTSLSRETPA